MLVAVVVAENNINNVSLSAGYIKGFCDSSGACVGVHDGRPFFADVIDEFSKSHFPMILKQL